MELHNGTDKISQGYFSSRLAISKGIYFRKYFVVIFLNVIQLPVSNTQKASSFKIMRQINFSDHVEGVCVCEREREGERERGELIPE